MKEIDLLKIPGITIGHASNEKSGTGCTVILCPEGGVAGVDVRGAAPASRETEVLKPVNMVEAIHAVMLSGGSAYGLAACDGAMRYLEERGKGFDVVMGVVPIVCGASLFDFEVGDYKIRPDAEMGYQACLNASAKNAGDGNIGAGMGASVGTFYGFERMMKSGLGSYALQVGELMVGAIVGVNALGNVYDPHTGECIAGLLSEDGTAMISTEDEMCKHYKTTDNLFNGNTTIGCIITNAKLTKTQANKLATTAHNGYAKAIRPVHTSVDGDTIFAISVGDVDAMPDAVGVMAVEAMSQAIVRAAKAANPAYGLKSHKDFISQK